MKPVILPESYNYVAVFLTLGCNLTCSYCINHLSGKAKRGNPIPGRDWARGLNRLSTRTDLPVTLQGGEPSLHPHFFQILRELDPAIPIDILTNLQFDPTKLVKAVSPERLRRTAPYASIRVSYHPETMNFGILLEKTRFLIDHGFSIGLYGVLHPAQEAEIKRAQEVAVNLGIDFRTKEFLGEHEGVLYGRYRYPGAVGAKTLRDCMCRTTELLISPSGDIHRCHHDLYNGILPTGSILDGNLEIEDISRPCSFFGNCNPCDVKVKTNRHQEFGHTSVVIENIRESGVSAQDDVASRREAGGAASSSSSIRQIAR